MRLVQGLMPKVWRCGVLFALVAVGCDRDDRRGAELPDGGGACADTVSRAATDYIPGDARGLVSLQVHEVVDFEREVVGRDALDSSSYRSVLDAMAACGMTRESVESITLAAGDGEDEVIGIVEGDGLGDESRLRCLEDELGSRSLLDDWTIERHGCDVRFVDGHGETVGFVAGPDMLVIATPEWLGHARGVSLGARPTPPKKLVRKIEERRTMWFAADFVEYQDELQGLPLVGGLETANGFVDLDSGFELEVAGSYHTREAAAAVATELEALRRRGRILAPEVGIPPRLLDRVAVKQHGREVKLTIDFSRSDVRRISEALTRT